MALRLLLTNLGGGLNLYPNHNTPSTMGGFNYGGSTSVFDTGTLGYSIESTDTIIINGRWKTS